MWDCIPHNVKCYSHPVGHRKGCDETALQKMCNVTHNLLVIGRDVIILPFTKSAMSLTPCWLWEQIWWDCPSQKCNITHRLLVAGWEAMKLLGRRLHKAYNLYGMVKWWAKKQRYDWWDSLTKMSHSLAVDHDIAWDLIQMRLPGKKFHSHTVSHSGMWHNW